MEQIAADSAKAIKRLAKASKDIAAQLHARAPVWYLVVTVERTSGFVYTPISNLSATLLRALNPKYATDLVGSIREQYLFPLSERGAVRELCDHVRRAPEVLPVGRLLILPVDQEGKPGDAAVFDSATGDDRNASDALKTYFGSHADLFTVDEWREPLNLLRQQASKKMKQPSEVFFLLRPEARFNGQTGRRARTLDLMQMGIALATGPAMATEAARICAQACFATSVGTLSLLHDKERYYERASRQAATGFVVKHGEATDIRDQYKFLEGLRDKRALNIPFPLVDKSDPDLRKPTSDPDRASWYVMPWIQLPKLSETILRGSRFKKYELGALMRAAVVHLRQDYWAHSHDKNERVPVPYSLWAPLLLAERAIREFTANARKVLEQVRDGLPVQHSRGVSVHDPAKVLQSKLALEAMIGKGGFKLKLLWDSESYLNRDVARPEVVLKKFSQAIKKLGTQQESKRPYARVVHGDAHFLNLLVDSSVPEDPLVISIDPNSLETFKPIDYRPDYFAQVKQTRRRNGSWARVEEELESVKHDPTYDVAKYLMSTACFYGLAREGFALNNLRSGSFQLTNKPQVNKPLSDTGGISTASLIRLGAGIPGRSLWNHLTCADAVVREFVRLFSLVPSAQNRQIDTNIGLIGLWLLAIEALFSAARTLLPGDLVGGSIVYLVTAAYMHDSCPAVLKVLTEERLRERKTQNILQDALRWKRLEEKVKRPEDA